MERDAFSLPQNLLIQLTGSALECLDANIGGAAVSQGNRGRADHATRLWIHLHDIGDPDDAAGVPCW